MKSATLTKYAWLSISAALATMALKTIAFLITGSVGLLSDAVESVVNLIGGLMALAMLTIAARPADENHAYGHSKAEYFSSGLEGGLILVAAVGISVAAISRLLSPKPLAELGIGLPVSIIASLINFGVAMLLLKVGREQNSITLEANAKHLLTDVWTSVGVVVAVGVVAFTDWLVLDPLIALVVAGNIVRTGVSILKRSVSGLMDIVLSAPDQATVSRVLQTYEQQGIKFHELRTRQAGAQKFVSVHVLVPGAWTVHDGHKLLSKIEADIRHALPEAVVFTHLESLEDPASWEEKNS